MSYSILHQRACQVLFREVETFCKRHPRHEKRAGRTPTYSDASILELVLLTNLCGLKGETAILRHAERHYRFYLRRLPSQSRLWVRWRDMSSYIVTFQQYLLIKLGVGLKMSSLSIPFLFLSAVSFAGADTEASWARTGATVPARNGTTLASNWDSV